MKITTFIENYKAKRFMNTKQGVDERIEWIKKELDIKEYIPFIEKQAIAQAVLTECASLSDDVIVIDSIQKYLLFTMAMLTAYTNIEADGSVSDVYDSLCSIKVDDGTMLDAIIKTFEIEYSRCNDILNMMTADLLAENNIEKQVGRFLSNVSGMVNKLGDGIMNNIGDVADTFDQLDIDKLINVIQKIK